MNSSKERQKIEVKQMFENLTLEDFEELQKRAVKTEQQWQRQGYNTSGPTQQVPAINTISTPKNKRVKVFKGKQRECDTHLIPGPYIVEWLESVEHFFKSQNEMDDVTKIRWLTSLTSEGEGNAQELIGNIADKMRDRPYAEVKDIIISTFAGTSVDDLIDLSTSLVRHRPQINSTLEVPDRIIVLRKHLRRIVSSYLGFPKFRTRNAHNGTMPDILLEFIFTIYSATLFLRKCIEKEVSGLHAAQDITSMTNCLQEEIQRTATDEEVIKAFTRHQLQEKSFLGAKSAIGLMSSTARKHTGKIFHTSSVENYDQEPQTLND